MALSTIGRNQLNTGIDDNSDATAITIDSSENVGIGTTSPVMNGVGTLLHIHASTATNLSGVHLTNNESGSGAADGLIVAKWSDGTNYFYDYENKPIVFGTDNTERLRIDASGRMTTPSQPSFQARSNISNLTLSNYAGATYHLNMFNAEYFDIGNNFNTTNSTFTAPVAGRYYFYTQLQLSSSPTTTDHSWGVNLHFQVNGGGNHANGYVSLSTGQGGGSTTLFGSYGLLVKENILNLSANDTVRVALTGNANINAGGIETNTNDGRCRFGGHLLG